MSLADNASKAAVKFASLPIARQIGLMIGIAASVAIGMGVVLWSRTPSYMPIYSQMSAKDSSEAMEVLQRNGIPFKIDPAQGILMVPSDELQESRLKLAGEGLPRGDTGGFDLFAGNNAFNSSQFMESARYKLALENELARTISQFHDIKSARVHLAIPRESAFVRDSKQPSASIFLDVYSGLELKKQTIAAIVNLVASSIPNMSPTRVTVVDQNGQLLSEGGGQTMLSNTERFQDYRQTLEQQYAQKIQDLLTPILGYGRVKAKVSAEMDFTSFEQTQEMYNPENAAVRSENTMQESRQANDSGASGIPGALANQPPQTPALNAAPNAPATPNPANPAGSSTSEKSNDVKIQTTKNFELDRTISHSRNQPGTIKRITVAVVVDNLQEYDPKTKKMITKPLDPKDIEQIKNLVSNAVGINTQRGDSIDIINKDFVKPEPVAPMPELKFWQTDFFWSIVKQSVGALFLLILILGLLRPLFKTLASGKVNAVSEGDSEQNELTYDGKMAIPPANDYEGQLSLLRHVVEKEPKRVAQVVKNWVDKG